MNNARLAHSIENSSKFSIYELDKAQRQYKDVEKGDPTLAKLLAELIRLQKEHISISKSMDERLRKIVGNTSGLR